VYIPISSLVEENLKEAAERIDQKILGFETWDEEDRLDCFRVINGVKPEVGANVVFHHVIPWILLVGGTADDIQRLLNSDDPVTKMNLRAINKWRAQERDRIEEAKMMAKLEEELGPLASILMSLASRVRVVPVPPEILEGLENHDCDSCEQRGQCQMEPLIREFRAQQRQHPDVARHIPIANA
jgi:hypothetical protein